MSKKYTADELNKCSKQELMLMVLSMQGQMSFQLSVINHAAKKRRF